MGTERARTTYNAGLEGTFTSLPFGDGLTTNSGGFDLDPYHLAMLDHDYEDETDHAQFRQYSEAQGRMMSPDPYGGSYDFSNPQSMNRYVYTMNNPLSYTDATGLDLVLLPDGCWEETDQTTDDSGNISISVYEDCGSSGGGGGSGGSGGGGGGSAPNNCPAGPANVYNFIHTNQAAANSLAQQSGVNADYLLGLSGWESQWGANRFAAQGNNFFSLHGGSSAPFANGSMQASRPPYVSLSTFPSYFASGQSFLAQYGNGLAGATSPAAFAQQLINNHFNSGNAATGGNPKFLSNTVTGINMVIRRKGC